MARATRTMAIVVVIVLEPDFYFLDLALILSTCKLALNYCKNGLDFLGKRQEFH